MPLIELSDAVEVVDGYKRRNPDSWSLCNSIRCDIGELPTIFPDDVRGVGEWEIDEQEVGGIFGGRQIVKIPCCSNCGTHNEWKTNYCPNCGARMEVSGDTRKN